MRVLVVGYGSMGARHARHARELGHDVAVADNSLESQARADKDGFAFRKGTVSFDAVVVATPAATHAREAARRHGVGRLLVEKPLALSRADWYAGKDAGPTDVAVGYQFRFQAHARALRDWVRAQPRRPAFALMMLRCNMATWPGRSYADALLECSHEIDLAQWLFGAPACLSAENAGATWRLQLRCGETLVDLRIDAASETYERWTAVMPRKDAPVAEQGWWGWDAPRGRSELLLPGGRHESVWSAGDDAYRAEMAAFLGGTWGVAGGCGLGDALAVLRVCDDARVSASRATVAREG